MREYNVRAQGCIIVTDESCQLLHERSDSVCRNWSDNASSRICRTGAIHEDKDGRKRRHLNSCGKGRTVSVDQRRVSAQMRKVVLDLTEFVKRQSTDRGVSLRRTFSVRCSRAVLNEIVLELLNRVVTLREPGGTRVHPQQLRDYRNDSAITPRGHD